MVVCTANFRFRGPIAKNNISKERQDYGDRSGPRILGCVYSSDRTNGPGYTDYIHRTMRIRINRVGPI